LGDRPVSVVLICVVWRCIVLRLVGRRVRGWSGGGASLKVGGVATAGW
jgi:hypothetical protein